MQPMTNALDGAHAAREAAWQIVIASPLRRMYATIALRLGGVAACCLTDYEARRKRPPMEKLEGLSRSASAPT